MRNVIIFQEGIDMFNVIDFLKQAVSIGASDVHLHPGEHPAVRRDGKIIKIDMPVLSNEDVKNALQELAPEHLKSKIEYMLDLDFAYEIKGVSRFRVNLSHQLAQYAISIRTIPYNIKKLCDLSLPDTLYEFAGMDNGLVLVTGPTGAGKSTTVAAILDHINSTYQKHIITIEDPVEFIFNNKKSIISQRQLSVDTASYSDGIKYALRQDPDVIFIGEIRDSETITNALKAAETGHLVFATIHTNNAIQTVNRIINMFTPADRPFVRNQLAEILRGTVSQKLVPLASGVGRRPACEVLVVTSTIKDLLEKNDLEQVYDLVKKGSFNNMISLNMSLYSMLQHGDITEDAALLASSNKNELKQMIRGVFHGTGLDNKN